MLPWQQKYFNFLFQLTNNEDVLVSVLVNSPWVIDTELV